MLIPFAVLILHALLLSAPLMAQSKPSWRAEWERVVEVARKEGKVVVYGPAGSEERVYLYAFQKAYPGIRVNYIPGRLSSLIPRLMAERRAGKYLADVMVGGTSTGLTFKRSGIVEPIPPLLVLPEVADLSAWFKKSLWFADRERKYVSMWVGNVSRLITINTQLGKTDEFRSYWDLLNPKWKGRIVAQDPTGPGGGDNYAYFLYVHRDLGPSYLRRLFGEMDVTLSRDTRQIVDWLGQRKFAIALFATGLVDEAIRQGLPLEEIEPRDEVMGIVGTGAASAVVLTPTPHPNASRVFLNWLLSREGQVAYQQATGGNSLRVDIPKKGIVDPAAIPQEDREYIFYALEDHKEKINSREFKQQILNDIVKKSAGHAYYDR